MKKLSKSQINKYNLGSVVSAQWGNKGLGNAQGIAGLAGLASGLLPQGSRGAGALSGAASGASMGAALGPLGMGVGAVLGGAIGLIGAGKRKRAEEEARNQMTIAQNANYKQTMGANVDTINENPYGIIEFANGGQVNPLSPVNTVVDNTSDIERAKQWQQFSQNLFWNPIELKNTAGRSSLGSKGGVITPEQQRAVDSTNFVNSLKLAESNTNKPVTMPQRYGQFKFANGGEVFPNLINIEKGELQIDPITGKVIREYTGVNPETGGIYQPHNNKGKDTDNNIVSAEEGTFIITKKEAKNYKDAIDNNDKLHLESIKMNIRNNKDKKEGTYKYGSYVKYAKGSTIDTNPREFNGNLSYSGAPIIPMSSITIPNQMQTAVNTGAGSTYRAPLDLSGVGNFAAAYGPSLLNIGRGLFGRVESQPTITPEVNPYQSQVISNMPQDVSYQPLVNELNRGVRSAFRRIDNTTSGSPIARANKNALLAGTQDRLAKIRLDNQVTNNQIRGQRAGLYNQLGQQQVANNQFATNYNLNVDNINAQNRAARQNMLTTGLGQLQQTYFNRSRNNQLYNMDMYRANLLRDIFPNTGFYDQFSPETLGNLIRG